MTSAPPSIAGIPVEFVPFACVLAGVARFHHFALRIALAGAAAIAAFKIVASPFKTGAGVAGFVAHLGHEWVILVNLLLLLLGSALLAKCFEVVVLGAPAALKQQDYSPIRKDETAGVHIDWARVGIVGFLLGAAVSVNVLVNLATISDTFLFLAASWQTAFGLGFLSSVFDSIRLTALAIEQGGYDWGFLACAVGFGGSMIWFRSSAGVARANTYPQARSVGQWLRHGWFVVVASVAGSFVLLAALGFHPGSASRGALVPGAMPAATAPAN